MMQPDLLIYVAQCVDAGPIQDRDGKLSTELMRRKYQAGLWLYGQLEAAQKAEEEKGLSGEIE